MVLGLRGQFSEMELETSIHRMVQGRWNKAKRGDVLILPPAGYEVDDFDQMVITTDEAVRQAIETVFTKFEELGSVRQVLCWWEDQNLRFPVQNVAVRKRPIVWKKPAYRMFLSVLHHPVFAGAYAFGKSKQVKEINPEVPGQLRTRRVSVPQKEWPVLLLDHHSGYISWERYQANQQRRRSLQQKDE